VAVIGKVADEEELAEGTLISHLVELRQRLVHALLAVLAVFLCLVFFMQDIFLIVARPMTSVLPDTSQVQAIGIASSFLIPLKTTLYVSLIIAMPIVLFQIWQFVAPGLYRREKRFAMPLLVSSIILFYAGIAFAYFIVFHLVFRFFFVTAALEGIVNNPDIEQFLSFWLRIIFAFGIAFEVPIATFMLVWSRLVSIETLSRIRRFVFLGAFVAGMFLTPPDIWSQTLLAIPIYLLYESGLILARILLREQLAEDRTAAAAAAEAEAEGEGESDGEAATAPPEGEAAAGARGDADTTTGSETAAGPPAGEDDDDSR
jgi:sec-independent protein translocase protein TatC